MNPHYLLTPKEWETITSGLDNQTVKSALENVYHATTIYGRFDALCELIDSCEEFIELNNSSEHAEKLQKNASDFAKAIVNAADSKDLTAKRKLRNEYKKIDPAYMPWPIPSTKLDITKFTDRKSYVKAARIHNFVSYATKKYRKVSADEVAYDKQFNIKYLTDSERERFRIFIAHGKLKQIKEDSATQRLILTDFETKGYKAHGDPDKAIFVISSRGEIFAGSTISKYFHHSSFLAGRPTFYAGTMIAQNGCLLRVDEYSGHYTTKFQQCKQMLAFFRKNGLLVPPLVMALDVKNEKKTLQQEEYKLKSTDILDQQLKIWPAMKFIYQQALKRNGDKAQAIMEVNNFKKQVAIEMSKGGQTLENVTYEAKVKMLINLHAKSFQQKDDGLNSDMIEDFKSLASSYINDKGKYNNDDLIIAEIERAKLFIVTKLESSSNSIFVENEFLAVKNELRQLMLSEIHYMKADEKIKGRKILARIDDAKQLKDLIEVALSMSVDQTVTNRRGMFSSLSLFENPIKIKLDDFLDRCYKIDRINLMESHAYTS